MTNETLSLSLLGDVPHKDFSIARSEFEKLIIYGPAGRRTYRFVKSNKKFVEVTPQFEAPVEQRVIEFFRAKISKNLTVEEPQTGFAAVRGDGPAED